MGASAEARGRGDQKAYSTTATRSPASTVSPMPTSMDFTWPAMGAVIEVSIFIASVTSKTWPFSTSSPTAA